MSRYGQINLIGIVALPLFAAAGSLIVFGARADTQLFVLGTNAIPMLIGGLVSGLLIRSVNKAGADGHMLALAPSLIPAVFGFIWYLYGAFARGADAGVEYFAGPFYLLGLAIIISLVAAIAVFVQRIGKSSS